MNQKDLIKYGLIALGAYLVWKYIQDHGGIDGLFGTVSAGGSDSAAKAAIAAAAAAKAKAAIDAAAKNPADPAAAAAAQKAIDDANATKAAADKARADDIAAHQKQIDDAAKKAAPTGVCTQPNFFNKDGVCVWGTVDANYGKPVSGMAAQPVLDTPQKVAQQALMAGFWAGSLLSMDQWCYYAGQAGVTCPDPGSIDPGVYEGAWYPGTGTDRTTPIDIGTWWAIVQTTGLSGVYGLGAMTRWTPAWLM